MTIKYTDANVNQNTVYLDGDGQTTIIYPLVNSIVSCRLSGNVPGLTLTTSGITIIPVSDNAGSIFTIDSTVSAYSITTEF